MGEPKLYHQKSDRFHFDQSEGGSLTKFCEVINRRRNGNGQAM